MEGLWRGRKCLSYHHSHESCHHSYEEAANYLTEGMYAQQHTAGAEHTGKQYEQTEPPQRIEIEDKRERCHGSSGAAYRRRVYGYLPPVVYYGTQYLHHERRHHYGLDDI